MAQTMDFFRLVKTGSPDQVQEAITPGVDVNARDSSGSTLLMLAAANTKNPVVISTLLKAGAEVNAKDDEGCTPFMHAARFNSNPEVLSVLLKAGADIDERDKDGWTMLMSAASYNSNPEVLSMLLKAGANIDASRSDGVTALMLAAWNSRVPEVVSLLLKAGANTRAKTVAGKTAFDYAQDNKDLKGTAAYWALNDAEKHRGPQASGDDVKRRYWVWRLIALMLFGADCLWAFGVIAKLHGIGIEILLLGWIPAILIGWAMLKMAFGPRDKGGRKG